MGAAMAHESHNRWQLAQVGIPDGPLPPAGLSGQAFLKLPLNRL